MLLGACFTWNIWFPQGLVLAKPVVLVLAETKIGKGRSLVNHAASGTQAVFDRQAYVSPD